MTRRKVESSEAIDIFEELESKMPFFAQTRWRENEVAQGLALRDRLLPVYRRVIENNILMDARLFVESLKRRELTRPECEKVKRLVTAFMERFLKRAEGN